MNARVGTQYSWLRSVNISITKYMGLCSMCYQQMGAFPKALNVFVLALLDLAIVAVHAQETLKTKEPHWTTIGQLKEARSHFHIRATSSHQVLIIGGYSRQNQEIPLLATASVEIIDTHTRTIHEESSMTEPHAEAALVQNGDSNLIIISGIGANNALTKTCEFYDRGLKSWHTIGSLIIARRNPMATFINNNEILVVGGTNEHGKPVIETEVFNINSGSRVVTRFPYSILEGRCSVSTGYFFGKAIVFAGKSNDNTIHREIYGYDRKNQKWEYQGVYIDSIFSPHLLRLFDERLFISGGIQPISRTDSTISNSTAIESYSGLKKTSSMILPRVNHSTVQWNNDSLLVIGGTTTNNTILNQTEWFNRIDSKWISGPTLKEARTNMQAISLPIFNSSGRQTQCRVIVVSGIGNENMLLSSVEMLERLNENVIVASNQEQNNIFRLLPFIQASPSVLISIIVFISCMTIALLYLVQSLREQAKIEYQHFRTLHEKEHLQLQITTLQLQTLHLQMKPHFIYNSLAAVESLILENKNKTASYYIHVLAKLLRMVLEHSDNSTVSVQGAIDFLKVYIALEQLRMSHTFDYTIEHTLSTELLDVFIPNMLIQPYVENSIKYGLGLLQDFNAQHPLDYRKGQLTVLLSHTNHEEKDWIVCIVEDNGVGRTKAQAVYSSRGSYRGLSRSTRINEQRLKLLSNLNIKEQHVQYEDLTDTQGAAIGTRVTLRIPILSHTLLGDIA